VWLPRYKQKNENNNELVRQEKRILFLHMMPPGFNTQENLMFQQCQMPQATTAATAKPRKRSEKQ